MCAETVSYCRNQFVKAVMLLNKSFVGVVGEMPCLVRNITDKEALNV